MPLYFPIAEMSLNVFMLLAMGAGVGLLSGMFGVGGGFLMTPLLIFAGVPPAVAVATEANEITAASVSGAVAHWRRGGIDVKLGIVLIAGGALGGLAGTVLFAYLRRIGQVDLMIALVYVLFLSVIGALMLRESIAAIRKRRAGGFVPGRKRVHHTWVHGLPFKMRFRKSRLYISVMLPIAIGFVVGLLAAIMGVGGGFIMIPAMIYILGMPGSVVVGTSLFQIIFVTAAVTVLHSINSQTVDAMLALILLTGAVFGAQVGARLGRRLRAEELRASLALIVLGVSARMLWGLVTEPAELYSVGALIQ